jgi:hypothetical protein
VSEKQPVYLNVTNEGGLVIIRLVEECTDRDCENYTAGGECFEVTARIDVDPEHARDMAFRLTTNSFEAEGSKT